jgi:tyrosyl-tRNA synthetase
MKAKEGLAMRVVTDLHGEEAAHEARAGFARVVQRKEAPEQVPEHRVPAGDGDVFLPKLLVTLGLAPSNSEAMRLIAQGGVHVDDAAVPSGTRTIPARPGATHLIKVGKRRFARVTFD